MYRATIEWDGTAVDVAVLALGDRPLLGTALLDGYNLSVDFVTGGDVRLQSVP